MRVNFVSIVFLVVLGIVPTEQRTVEPQQDVLFLSKPDEQKAISPDDTTNPGHKSVHILKSKVPNFGPDFTPSREDNMNGDYVFSSTPGGTPGLFPKRYADYPGGAEHYDVYSPPISTLYSQVWWSPLAPVALPEAMVKNYAGKGMAIIGWEIDQVRRTSNGDVSVPISASYNHHYVSQLIGAKARFRKVKVDGPHSPLGAELLRQSGHGAVAWEQPQYVVEQTAETALPTSQPFSSANGGEYRKTYHGFPPGYALVVDSPSAMQISPMQIDTWNREAMNISGPLPPRFVPGPLPRASQAPIDAHYSGLLECPMTTHISKAIDSTYTAKSQGACGQRILTYQECFHSAASLLADGHHSFINHTISVLTLPRGCSATVDTKTPLSVHIYFNELLTSEVECAADAKVVRGTTASLVRVSVSLNATSQLAELTLEGPASVWFAAGFGAHAMADEPWTVVVDGHGDVVERKLGNQAPGTVLAASVTVLSNAVVEGLRTVVLSRPLRGAGDGYFTFEVASEDNTIPILVAVGSGPDYAYHKDKAPTTITLLPLDGAASPGACVCPTQPKPFGEATGKLVYHPAANVPADTGSGAVGFGAHKCPGWPHTDLLNHTNPTCDIRHYRGGQWACHHMWSLLDMDQGIPWADQPLVLHHKYRFWVQPYDPSYHTQVKLGEREGSALLLGSPWEFDVPKCADGVPGCSLVDGSWIHTVKGSTMGRHNFVALNFHCHAPTCLSMAVYACAKGTALADCNDNVGKLLCIQRPVYGGTGHPALNGTRFDETGYIAIPDCFWGDAEFGLESPIDLDGVPLHMVKTANATWGHTGEMAGGQPWVF
ncbi:hypothetical protein CYMTET_29564 [Cymbomonas tetramitiformis]|uniref:Uncharacterized protein n=1 Tax=Cymbomonas tetramitiformis TaxID=36881 RepID=A0AAE0FKI2_9CHLO|nr:hypothetical protein CYMTET_46515 [Cymbomonas tetramitiformis]KAK3261532.1 hypothetical protein CYMTET_29564 [Cymbomonas tetramitiformis]